MKKIFTTLFLFFALLSCFAQTSVAQEDDKSEGEKVKSFATVIQINEDATANITETIVYDFGKNEKHGIFRFIPIKYKTSKGNTRKIKIHEISITNELDEEYNFEISYPGKNIKFKIGDADKFVTGEKIYIISYTVNRAFNYFDDWDEFYWNVNGNEWPVETEKVTAKVFLPENSKDEISKIECFTGSFGSKNTCFSEKNNKNDASFSHQNLSAKNGLTIVIGLPKEVVYQPTTIENLFYFLKDNWGILFLPVITLLILLYLWNRHGRDPAGREVIITQFDAPDDLTPAEVGTIVDEKAQNKDVTAEIISLAVKRYLRITKLEKKILRSQDYELEKLKEGTALKKDFDRKIMESIFKGTQKVKLSDLKNSFYKDLKKIKKQLYKRLVTDGYFPRNPKNVRLFYLITGGVIIFLGLFPVSMIILVLIFGSSAISGVVVSGILVIIFSFFMSARTRKGVLAKEHILGLKSYLTVAEKDRIKFHNAPNKNPKQFEKFLPFAMALGVEEEWAEQFEDIYKENPDWYSDPSGAGSAFNAVALAKGLSSFSNTANSSLSSSPSSAGSGGSGFSGGGSGGGFGGGGGGSW